MGVLDDVVLGLVPARVAGEAALGAQRVEGGAPAGEHLVDVGLVAGVENDPVARGVEDPVDRQSQLDHAEVGAEVAATAGARCDQLVADLGRKLVQLAVVESAQVRGPRS